MRVARLDQGSDSRDGKRQIQDDFVDRADGTCR